MGFTLEGNEMKELITEQDQKAFRQWITDWSKEFERQRNQKAYQSIEGINEMTFEEIKQHHLTDAQLEALLTEAHKAGRAVGHGRTKIITDYPNLSKHYAKYAMQTIKENHDDTEIPEVQDLE